MESELSINITGTIPKGFIIEGPDGVGKTTLSRQLNEKVYHGNASVTHIGPPATERLFDEFFDLFNRRLESKQPFILDRGYLGELIYGPLLRDRSRLCHQEAIMLNMFCQANGIAEISCLVKFETSYKSWSSRRGEELITDRLEFQKANNAWGKLFSSGVFSLTPYNWEFNAPDFPLVIDSAGFDPASGILGPSSAEVLMVADRTNGRYDLPFFTSNRSGCSFYFLNFLKGIGWQIDTAVVNATKLNGLKTNIRCVTKQMRNLKTVIALGSEASHELKRQKVEHKVAPHPQYWKRFHYKDPDGYVKIIREAHYGKGKKAEA